MTARTVHDSLGSEATPVAAGTSLYMEGEAAERLYLLVEGRLRLSKRVRKAERTLSVLGPGRWFGQEALLPQRVRGASAVALTDVQVVAVEPVRARALLRTEPGLADSFLEDLLSRLLTTEEQLENAMLRDAPSRVVNALCRRLAGNPSTDPVRLSISPLELSSLAGLDVDAVKKVVQQLRDGGYVHIADESVVVPDPEALRRLFAALTAKEEVRGGA